MDFGLPKINLPSPKAIVNTVKDAVGDVAGAAVDTAKDVAGDVTDLTSKVTGPLSISKLGLEMIGKAAAKGTDSLLDKVSDVADDVKDAFSDLVTPDHSDDQIHAGGRGIRVASTSDGGTLI